MPIGYNKTRVFVSTDAIVDNFRLISGRASRAMPVIKSDAYGHGLVATGLALEAAGARECAVGTVGEGVQLRDAGLRGDIVALLGAHDDEDAAACAAKNIIPTVFNLDGIARLASQSNPSSPLKIVLKFDTGMARLGFNEKDIPALCDKLRATPQLLPVVAASHLAVADNPGQSNFTRQQGETFSRIMTGLRATFPHIMGSLANSAATLGYPDLHWDIQRPGIALYGSNPLRNTILAHCGHGLRPAMSVCVPVLQVHGLPAGHSTSYGHTFTAESAMNVAVIAAGYADAYSRGLSNRGTVIINGCRARILGRVCMQTCIVDVTGIPGVQAGDEAWLLGGTGASPINCDELADTWGTISYEVLCLLGMNPRQPA